MNTLNRLLLVLLLAMITHNASAQIDNWVTLQETTPNGDTVWYETGDTLDGNVFSNDCIAIRGRPVFRGAVYSTCPDFIHGEGYDPAILVHAFFNMPPMTEPFATASSLRQNGIYVPVAAGHVARVRFMPGTMRVWTWVRGTPFDSTNSTNYTYGMSTCFFFDCPIQICGRVQGQVTVGCSYDIEIIDNIQYACSDMYGNCSSSCSDFLGLVSERNIKIANTVANGRENSAGLGRNQTERNLTSIVIDAALEAPNGCLTFSEQNDPDSGYVCDCTPDERGNVYIYGSVVQGYHGFLHRDFNGGTGYRLRFTYDIRFLQYRPPCFMQTVNPQFVTADTLDFGNIPVGITAWDTTMIYTSHNSILGGVNASFPFHGFREEPFTGWQFPVPVSITPTQPITYRGVLTVNTSVEIFQIVLLANGIPPHSPELAEGHIPSGSMSFGTTLCASPNPFNISNELRYTLTEASPVKLTLYDIQGREIRRFEMNSETAGEHSLHLDAAGMASGVYFVHLQTTRQTLTQKLLLLK